MQRSDVALRDAAEDSDLGCSESKATDSKSLKTQSIAMLRFDVEPFEVVEDSAHYNAKSRWINFQRRRSSVWSSKNLRGFWRFPPTGELG